MIELKNLQKVIAGRTALDIPELTIRAGEVAALIGPEGSGRRELLALLTGRMRPTAGTVRVAGVDPRLDRDAFSRQTGVLFAEDALYRNESALGNLTFHCRLRGLPPGRAEEVLVAVGLADQATVRADRLPSGLARRLAFGRAILHRPPILLLAEPFARCDETSIALLSHLMRQLAAGGGALLILASDPTYLASLCDTIYTLDQGRLAEAAHLAEEPGQAAPFKVPVRQEGKVALVSPGDILYAEAEGGRACLYTREARLPTQFTIAELETRLARGGFFRAHRGYLVNLQHVKEIIPYTRNSFTLRLDDPAGTEIPLSLLST